jgi:hypothetical protein
MENMQRQGALDVLGDTILVLDGNLQVVWVWDSFDHMDPNRAAVLRETCSYPATLACSTFYDAPVAHDWLHGNSLQLTPDGNILYSARYQDWVIKIEYRNGAGSGQVLWPGGDFTMLEGNEKLWLRISTTRRSSGWRVAAVVRQRQHADRAELRPWDEPWAVVANRRGDAHRGAGPQCRSASELAGARQRAVVVEMEIITSTPGKRKLPAVCVF